MDALTFGMYGETMKKVAAWVKSKVFDDNRTKFTYIGVEFVENHLPGGVCLDIVMKDDVHGGKFKLIRLSRCGSGELHISTPKNNAQTDDDVAEFVICELEKFFY